MKKGFSLVEMLVVIGVIGILMGVLLASFKGATETARGAKCVANLKSLAQAANNYAMGTGYYPTAGSYEWKARKVRYYEANGWVSWRSNNGKEGRKYPDYDGRNGMGYNAPSHQTSVNCPCFGTGIYDDDMFVLSNGQLWQACGKNKAIYICPTHQRTCQEASIGEPLFSYVMNAKFLYDKSGSVGYVNKTTRHTDEIAYGSLSRADRTLMFCDIHMDKTASRNGETDPKYDQILNYKASVDGEEYGKDWTGEKEQIGFSHKGAGGRNIAHVAFADGHVEKLIEPRKNAPGIDVWQLTALLCEGKDISFNGTGYYPVKDE